MEEATCCPGSGGSTRRRFATQAGTSCVVCDFSSGLQTSRHQLELPSTTPELCVTWWNLFAASERTILKHSDDLHDATPSTYAYSMYDARTRQQAFFGHQAHREASAAMRITSPRAVDGLVELNAHARTLAVRLSTGRDRLARARHCVQWTKLGVKLQDSIFPEGLGLQTIR